MTFTPALTQQDGSALQTWLTYDAGNSVLKLNSADNADVAATYPLKFSCTSGAYV